MCQVTVMYRAGISNIDGKGIACTGEKCPSSSTILISLAALADINLPLWLIDTH